jgi:hypothetical protein
MDFQNPYSLQGAEGEVTGSSRFVEHDEHVIAQSYVCSLHVRYRGIRIFNNAVILRLAALLATGAEHDVQQDGNSIVRIAAFNGSG